jgi:hypothetical protein
VVPPLIVAGMHRSGTSLVASLLSGLSVDMGRELLAGDSHNVRGYFEDVDFLTLQRRMLSEGCARDDGGHPDWGWTEHETLEPDGFERFVPDALAILEARRGDGRCWGWKDPRTTLLLDFWDRLTGGAARYLLVYRFPWDVADSMQRLGAEVFLRNPEYAWAIWTYYNRHLRDFYVTHRDRCLLVSINALSGNLDAFTHALRAKLGIEVPPGEPASIFDGELLQTLAPRDALVDLVSVMWPKSTQLLSELDAVADLGAAGLWRAESVRSRLARPDDGQPVDVSVIVPCYDQGTFLVEAVASVERTAPPGCELIIVNDGSREPRTLEVLDTLKTLGYYVWDQDNQGLAGARNAGVALARGRYILPLDADNRLRERYIEDAMRVLDANPSVGIVYGDRNDFGLRTCPRRLPDFDLPSLLELNYIDACAVFRKQIWIDSGGYDASMFAVEDWELWIQAAEQNWGFHHLPFLAFDYRVRPDSMLSQAAGLREELRRRMRKKHADLYLQMAFEQGRRLAEHAADHGTRMHALADEAAGLRDELARVGERLTQAFEESRRLAEYAADHGARMHALVDEAAGLRDELARVSERLTQREAEIAEVKRSWGWRLGLFGRRIAQR